MLTIGIIGIGFVGTAMMESFIQKGYRLNENLFGYDKYKETYNSEEYRQCIVKVDIVFLVLPTLYNDISKEYDLSGINENLDFLKMSNYKGLVVLKSTVDPLTCNMLALKYELDIVHNPEFLTARTAFNDFHNQLHIVLGKTKTCSDTKFQNIYDFYKNNYNYAEISVCDSTESESMKSFLNSFYAIKVQFFTEIYMLCDKLHINYDTVRDLMLKNGWINKMHTNVPGPDGKVSYGGMCFPKDTNALLQFMIKNDSPHAVLENTIKERNEIRKD